MREVLVVGGRGRVGREVLRALGQTSANVRSLVRKPSVTAPAGAREVVGELGDRASLDAALAGVESAFFITPHDEREEQLGETFIAAATAAGVRRIVFASAFHPDFTSKLGFSLFVGLMGLLTHYGPKLRVERRVRLAKANPVVLMPSNFYQNDELYLPEILAGRYPQPLGTRGVNRVDCADIGAAAARALTDESVDAGAYPMVGPEPALTGPECAAVWARVLGRDVAYDGDLERWWALVEGRMHASAATSARRTSCSHERVLPRSRASSSGRSRSSAGRRARTRTTWPSVRVRLADLATANISRHLLSRLRFRARSIACATASS